MESPAGGGGGGGGTEDVNEFLQRIRELGDKRDREDAERTRKLEAEIIAGREARRARRDERARSISPQKDSPLANVGLQGSSAITSTRAPYNDEPNTAVSPATSPGRRSNPAFDSVKLPPELSSVGETPTPSKQPPLLSWQRRPKSMYGTIKSPDLTSFRDDESPAASRSSIAASLEGKDPAYFRQTTDKVATSGALRKAEDEGLKAVGRTALPGMSRSSDSTPEPSSEPTNPARHEFEKRGHRESLDTVSSALSYDQSLESLSTKPSSNDLPTVADRFGGSSADAFSRPIAMSPSQERMNDTGLRTPSPTKGLGGFVQSAMLKREGSVNKRWSNSQQGDGSLSRTNSFTSLERPLLGQRTGDSPAMESFPREQISVREIDRGTRSRADSVASVEPSTRPVTRHARAKSMRSLDTTPPLSPGQQWTSKTMDQKRWSPQKSSWLESALKKSADAQSSPGPQNKPAEFSQPAKPYDKTASEKTSEKPLAKPKPVALTNQDDKPVEPAPKTPTAQIASSKPAVVERSSVNSPILRRSPSPEKLEALWKPPPPKKPEVINFRASLKPRPVVDKDSGDQSPEFLNARQQLRSTKTEKVKPPDEFKEKILQRRKSLHHTGGPQKIEKVDPLKETVVAARAQLGRSHTPGPGAASPSTVDPKLGTAAPISRQKTGPAKFPVEKPITKTVEKPAAKPIEKPIAKPLETPIAKPIATGPLKTPVEKPIGGGLASRITPNLANLLQRGPPLAGQPKAQSTAANGVGKADEVSEGVGPGPALEHMTKSRARGPKRRAPTTAKSSDSVSSVKPTSAPSSATPSKLEVSTPKFGRELPVRPGPPPKSLSASSFNEKPKEITEPVKNKPPMPQKSPMLRRNSDISIENPKKNALSNVSSSEDKVLTPPPIRSSSRETTRKISGEKAPKTTSPIASRIPHPSVDEDEESDFAATSSLVSQHAPLFNRAKENTIPARPLPEPPMRSLPSSRSVSPEISRTSAYSSRTSSPEVPRALPKLPPRSPSPIASELSLIEDNNAKLLADFFNGPATTTPNVDFDIIGLLSSSPAGVVEKVKTTKLVVSEVKSHGKLDVLPKEYEHVFFNECMYIIVHHFIGRSDKESRDVYFWSGNQVPAAAVEDAQLFARKTARDEGAKLIKLTQCKETAAFLQAIGGILITRRGFPGRSALAGNFLLCGRVSGGSVVFDEVDMKSASLCSGFAFVMFARGKVYLWKGRGATREEIGVARLVAVQVSGGDFVECAEEEEPDAFFEVLGGFEDYSSADYWHLRPTCRKYAARLFKVDRQSQFNITEIAPFSQADLDPREIYIADAFFEFYIFIGSQAQSRRDEFQIALKFTQEYAMLAVSVEDRPFMPVSSVILGGAPKEFKALFRTWDSAHPAVLDPVKMVENKFVQQQASLGGKGLGRQRSIRIVSLNEAMNAMRA